MRSALAGAKYGSVCTTGRSEGSGLLRVRMRATGAGAYDGLVVGDIEAGQRFRITDERRVEQRAFCCQAVPLKKTGGAKLPPFVFVRAQIGQSDFRRRVTPSPISAAAANTSVAGSGTCDPPRTNSVSPHPMKLAGWSARHSGLPKSQ